MEVTGGSEFAQVMEGSKKTLGEAFVCGRMPVLKVIYS